MKLNTDRIVSLSAMAVGVGSLFIILYQTHLMREAQHASALPYLAVAVQSGDDGVYLTLRNVGVGPALIEDVRVRSGRELFDGDAYEFYARLRPDPFAGRLSVDPVMRGRLLPAGETIQMLGMGGEAGGGEMLADLLRRFEIAEVPESWYDGVGAARRGPQKAVLEITYSSIYGERWRIRSNAIVPDEL